MKKQVKGVLSRLLRKPKGKKNATLFEGPHWRRSVNVMLQSHGPVKATAVTQTGLRDDFTRSETSSLDRKNVCLLLQLPKEIRHLVEEYLPRVDVVCLRQTCQKLRHESKNDFLVQNLSSKQLYSLRTRLDRECFWELCHLEERKEIGNQLAVCSFCRSLHDRRAFAAVQLRLLPQERVCAAVSREFLVCGRFSTTPASLRLALEEVLATGRSDWRTHHWMPDAEAKRDTLDDTHFVLSRAIEKSSRTPERRSTLLVEDSGLIIEHHFHLQSQSTLLPIGWNITAALAHPKKGITPICPHHTIQTAGIEVGNRRLVESEYMLCCRASGCRTHFAFFECGGDEVGWKDLCFRVKRGFGWVENVGDGSWDG